MAVRTLQITVILIFTCFGLFLLTNLAYILHAGSIIWFLAINGNVSLSNAALNMLLKRKLCEHCAYLTKQNWLRGSFLTSNRVSSTFRKTLIRAIISVVDKLAYFSIAIDTAMSNVTVRMLDKTLILLLLLLDCIIPQKENSII